MVPVEDPIVTLLQRAPVRQSTSCHDVVIKSFVGTNPAPRPPKPSISLSASSRGIGCAAPAIPDWPSAAEDRWSPEAERPADAVEAVGSRTDDRHMGIATWIDAWLAWLVMMRQALPSLVDALAEMTPGNFNSALVIRHRHARACHSRNRQRPHGDQRFLGLRGSVGAVIA